LKEYGELVSVAVKFDEKLRSPFAFACFKKPEDA